MSLNAVQGQQGGKDGERTRLFPAPATGYSNGQSAPSTDVEQPSRLARRASFLPLWLFGWLFPLSLNLLYGPHCSFSFFLYACVGPFVQKI